MNLYDVTAQVAALTAERDAALARVRELEAEAERLRAENAALRRANDVASEQWREGLLVVEDCRRLLRSVLGEGVTPELRQLPSRRRAERSKIPYEISLAVAIACESDLFALGART